ncbi:uncharacterized protein VTP21DRAFT_1290 [Calcarisporiella thermophila]|uniref:uncharacterized protein n=1 Tax=Calcarisporiella thermophila TaxID=911321 RepID=UPI00374421DB
MYPSSASSAGNRNRFHTHQPHHDYPLQDYPTQSQDYPSQPQEYPPQNYEQVSHTPYAIDEHTISHANDSHPISDYPPEGYSERVPDIEPYPPYGFQQQNPAHSVDIYPAEASVPFLRYGEAPRRQPRRYKTVKRVQLTGGNLILDCPVSSRYLEKVKFKEEKEFTHMRYSAATCDPNDFMKEHLTLRQALMGRSTELFICITMYNEDEILFARTMHGVMKNIAHLCTRERSRTWGREGWKKVVDGVAKNVVNGKPVTSHIYEFTTQISIDPDLRLRGADLELVPVQMLFCLKEKNQKKINSHRWFFSAFGPVLNPNVCVLLDVGTRPGNTSIYHIWKTFDLNSNVGGACGEIVAMKGKVWVNLLNPLVAAQNFEYKMSNILDKPLESVFGYISVLPGAFSAYRYIALQNDETGKGPLASYFKGETQHGGDADVFTANMYLAEDRILCFELVAKKRDAWVLRYVKSARGETDVPDSVPEFISQRRRWLNGSFFAAVYALCHFTDIYRTGHSAFRLLLLHIEFLYQLYSLIFAWLAPANFYITFYFLASALERVANPPFASGVATTIRQVLSFVYLMLLIIQFVMALGNRPQGSKWAYTAIMIFFALIMGYMLFASIYITYQSIKLAVDSTAGAGFERFIALISNGVFRDILISFALTYFIYFLSSLLYFDPWHMFTSFVQYIFMMPSYINVLNIYAFCNTHDISWGTKGDTVATDLGVVKTTKQENGVHTADVTLPTEPKDIDAAFDEAMSEMSRKAEPPRQARDDKTKREDYYRSFRTQLVVFWILTNAILVVLITMLTGFGIQQNATDRVDYTNTYLAIVLWSVVVLSAIRLIGSIAYLILHIVAG